MKTLFLNPPSFRGYDGGAGSRYQAKREIRSFWYPTWLAQAAALVEGSRLVDAPVDELTPQQVAVVACDYELIIIYTSTASLTNDAAAALLIRKLQPGALIAFVGPHVTVMPEESLRLAPAVDFVVRREFEIPVHRIAQGEPVHAVEGVSWRDGDVIRHNADAPLVTDLDGLPFVTDVYKRDLAIEKYYIGYLQHPYLSLYTGRGCPGRCTFCLWPQTISGHSYRVRSPQSVYAELAKARALFPEVKEFFIDDDTFTANADRAAAVARLISTMGITWSTSSRVNVKFDTLKTLKACGLRLLMVGFESGSDEILANAHKGADTALARRFMRDCRTLGIAVHGTFMLGLPGETSKTIEQTIDFARELSPDTMQVSIATPYPGTELYRQALEEGLLADSELVSSDGTQTCALTYNGLSGQDIMESVARFYKRFYFRPRVLYAMGKQMLADPEVRKRRLREGGEFISFLKRRETKNDLSKPGLGDVIRDGGPGFCQFAITDACNAACGFCNFSAGSDPDRRRVFVRRDEALLALDILAANGVGFVLFVGGEPTLHPHLFEMISYAKSLGINTMVCTNGTLLTDDYIRQCADAGLDSIIISVDACTAAAHETNRGIPGLCDRIAQANQSLAQAGISSTASVTISRLLEDITKLPGFLTSLGFSQVTFSYPLRSLQSSFRAYSDSQLLDYSDEELVSVFDSIIRLKKSITVANPSASLREMKRFVMGKAQRFPCIAGLKYFYLDWNFDLYRCHAWHEPMCRIWEFDESKTVRDGCTKCMIDCYRDASVLHHVGIALYDARTDFEAGHPALALRRLMCRATIESARAVMEDRDWIKGL